MFTICCPRRVKMFFTKRQSLLILKAVVFVFVFSLYFLVLIKESMNVMENNAKSKTVTASKVDNVSKIVRMKFGLSLKAFKLFGMQILSMNHRYLLDTQFLKQLEAAQNSRCVRQWSKVKTFQTPLTFIFPQSTAPKHVFMLRICFA